MVIISASALAGAAAGARWLGPVVYNRFSSGHPLHEADDTVAAHLVAALVSGLLAAAAAWLLVA